MCTVRSGRYAVYRTNTHKKRISTCFLLVHYFFFRVITLLSSVYLVYLSSPPLRDAGFADECFLRDSGDFAEGLADEGFWAPRETFLISKTSSKKMPSNFGTVLPKMRMKGGR